MVVVVEGVFVSRCPKQPVDSCSISAGLQGGQVATPATRWRRRTTFSHRAALQSGLPLSRLGCPNVEWAHPSELAGSLWSALHGPGFLLSLPRGLPRLGGEAEAEPPGWTAQWGDKAFLCKGVQMTTGHSPSPLTDSASVSSSVKWGLAP